MSHEFIPPTPVVPEYVDCTGSPVTGSLVTTDALTNASRFQGPADILVQTNTCVDKLDGPMTDCDSFQALDLASHTLGADSTGLVNWYTTNPSTYSRALEDIELAPGTGALYVTLIDVGPYILPTPTECDRLIVNLKNITALPVVIQAAALIDGVASITLQGTSAGAYPFGANGGESVTLVYFAGENTWHIF